MDFGKYLKQIRESRSLSVRELAKRANVSHAHISQIETGQRGIPKPDTIRKLAEGLNWEYDDLMLKAGYGIENEKDSLYDSANEEIRSDVDQIVEILQSVPEAERKSFLDQVDTLAEIVKRKYEKSRSQ